MESYELGSIIERARIEDWFESGKLISATIDREDGLNRTAAAEAAGLEHAAPALSQLAYLYASKEVKAVLRTRGRPEYRSAVKVTSYEREILERWSRAHIEHDDPKKLGKRKPGRRYRDEFR